MMPTRFVTDHRSANHEGTTPSEDVSYYVPRGTAPPMAEGSASVDPGAVGGSLDLLESAAVLSGGTGEGTP